MSRIKISSSLIILLAVLLLGFSSVVQAEEVPKGPNGEELMPGSEAGLTEDGKMEAAISDELSGIGAEPEVPTLENSIELKDEPAEEKNEAAQPMTNVSDAQAVSSWKEDMPFLIIIIVMVLAALALLIFAFRRFKDRK